MCERLVASSDRARIEENPPFMTAGAEFLHNKDDALVPRSFPVEEAVHNVRAKVHAQAHRDDEHAHRGDVNCEPPPVHEA